MFRLAVPALLSCAGALNDETSLMQGLKPQQVAPKEDKSKAISNLLETATSMLKNGATPDVVDFAQATLIEITSVVEPAIINATRTDQAFVDSTWAMFGAAIDQLEQKNIEVLAAHNAERDLSARHKTCRNFVEGELEKSEETLCHEKRQCDYELWAIWRRFVSEESILRQQSLEIETLFCAEDANGTVAHFRASAAALMPPWLEQKPKVEDEEAFYDEKVPLCETAFTHLDDKTAACDALQTQLEQAACTHVNKVIETRNLFAEAWIQAVYTYQQVIEEVHCLEIDRWKEWRTLASVQCLLRRTTDRNGRPCDESTDEVQTEVLQCEAEQVDTSIDHLRINYREVPEFPPSCPTPPWQVDSYHVVGRCVPVVPKKPCDDTYISQEYADLWDPPTPEFHSPDILNPTNFESGNSHCNPRVECTICEAAHQRPYCDTLFSGHGSMPTWFIIPSPEHECSEATRQQQWEGVFDALGDGHFDPWELFIEEPQIVGR